MALIQKPFGKLSSEKKDTKSKKTEQHWGGWPRAEVGDHRELPIVVGIKRETEAGVAWTVLVTGGEKDRPHLASC